MKRFTVEFIYDKYKLLWEQLREKLNRLGPHKDVEGWQEVSPLGISCNSLYCSIFLILIIIYVLVHHGLKIPHLEEISKDAESTDDGRWN